MLDGGRLPADDAGRTGSLDPAHFAALRACGLFDPDYYLAAYPDVRPSGLDPLVHFCEQGWRAGRLPNPYFDPAWYLERNPDVRMAGYNPLLHYCCAGEPEGRRPVPYFDPAWYRRAYVVPPDQLCLAHFLARRHGGTVSPVPEFDAAHYVASYPDVAAAGIDPFEHYLHQGHKSA